MLYVVYFVEKIPHFWCTESSNQILHNNFCLWFLCLCVMLREFHFSADRNAILKTNHLEKNNSILLTFCSKISLYWFNFKIYKPVIFWTVQFWHTFMVFDLVCWHAVLFEQMRSLYSIFLGIIYWCKCLHGFTGFPCDVWKIFNW